MEKQSDLSTEHEMHPLSEFKAYLERMRKPSEASEEKYLSEFEKGGLAMAQVIYGKFMDLVCAGDLYSPNHCFVIDEHPLLPNSEEQNLLRILGTEFQQYVFKVFKPYQIRVRKKMVSSRIMAPITYEYIRRKMHYKLGFQSTDLLHGYIRDFMRKRGLQHDKLKNKFPWLNEIIIDILSEAWIQTQNIRDSKAIYRVYFEQLNHALQILTKMFQSLRDLVKKHPETKQFWDNSNFPDRQAILADMKTFLEQFELKNVWESELDTEHFQTKKADYDMPRSTLFYDFRDSQAMFRERQELEIKAKNYDKLWEENKRIRAENVQLTKELKQTKKKVVSSENNH